MSTGSAITTLAMFGVQPIVAIPAGVLVLVAIIAWGRRRHTAELVTLMRRRVGR